LPPLSSLRRRHPMDPHAPRVEPINVLIARA
jgi:hypothetical protein